MSEVKFKACDLRASAIVVQEHDFDRVTAERDALAQNLRFAEEGYVSFAEECDKLQQRLTAADERADLLSDLLLRTLSYYTESCFPEDLLLEVKSALKVIP